MASYSVFFSKSSKLMVYVNGILENVNNNFTKIFNGY